MKKIIFIHGIIGDENSFGNFPDLIKNDSELHYEVIEPFTYFTHSRKRDKALFLIAKFPIIRKIGLLFIPKAPKIQSIARSLKTFIENRTQENDEIVLVCHSMGGLIARKYLLDEITLYRNPLRVKEVVLFATPNNGADLAALDKYIRHPQVSQLRKDSDFIEFLNQKSAASSLGQSVYIKYFRGTLDQIVDYQSAMQYWGNPEYREIGNKDHKNIVKPDNSDDESYRSLKNYLLEKKVKRYLTDQPDLILKCEEGREDIARLHYTNTFIEFQERLELIKLNSFINCVESFRWWVVYAEGGSGKSRLALEIGRIIKQNQGWNSGFYSLDDDFEFTSWIIENNTFLIIDYAAKGAEKIKYLLEKIQAKFTTTSYKVRVLLLERSLEIPNDWYNNILLSGDSNTLLLFQYDDPLLLQTMSDEHLIHIMEKFITIDDHEKSKLLDKLQEIDEKKRPLFAAMLADYMQQNDHIDISRDSVIEEFIKRTKRNYWKDVDSHHFYLAALITICGKLDSRFNFDQLDPNNFPTEKTIKQEILSQVLGHGKYSDAPYMAMEPDLIAEKFVLEVLRVDNNYIIKMGTENYRSTVLSYILQKGWEISPIETLSFLYRTSQDFFKHPSFIKMFNVIPIKENSKLLWSMLSANLINTYGKAKETETARALLDKIKEIVNVYPENEGIAQMYVQGSFNLITAFSKSGEIETARMFLGEIKEIAKVYPANENIALDYVKGAFNLIIAFSNIGEKEMARAFLDEIKEMVKAYPANEEIRMTCAKGSVNLISAFGTAGETARMLLDGIEEMAKAYPSNEEMVLEWVSGSYNLINAFGETGEIEKALRLLDEIKEIVKVYPSNEEIALKFAKGSFNLITAFSKTGDIEVARTLLDKIKEIAKAYPENKGIALSFAQGSYNLINAFGETGKLEAAHTLFDEFKEMTKAYLANEEIVLECAEGGFNLIVDYWKAGELEKALKLLDEIKELTKVHPSYDKIALAYMKGCVNLIKGFGDVGKIKTASKLLDSIEEMVKAYVSNEEITLFHAKGIVNLISAFCEAGEITTARILLDRVEEMSKIYSASEEIILMYAIGRYKLMLVCGEVEVIVPERMLLEWLEEMTSKFPHNSILAILYDQIYNNLYPLNVDK